MAPRCLVQREPVSESPELAWHAYAVEYGLRARSLGLRVCAVDIPLTHNSLTMNLDRLDAANRAVAASHPDALPVRVPAGIIASPSDTGPGAGILSSHRWRYRWLRESVPAHLGRLASQAGSCVLSDIRFDIDNVISSDPDSSLLVINLDPEDEFTDEQPGPLELMRRAYPLQMISQPLPRLIDRLAARDSSASKLLTNLEDGGPASPFLESGRTAMPPGVSQGGRLLDAARTCGYSGSAAVAVSKGNTIGNASARVVTRPPMFDQWTSRARRTLPSRPAASASARSGLPMVPRPRVRKRDGAGTVDGADD